MVNLPALQQHFLKIHTGALTLDPTDQAIPMHLQDFLKLSPVGKVTWRQIQSTDICLQEQELTVTGNIGAAWPIQGMLALRANIGKLTLRITPSTINIVARAELPLPGNQTGIVILKSPIRKEAPWTISMESISGKVDSMGMFRLIRGDIPLPYQIPESLNVLSSPRTLLPNGLYIGFFPQTNWLAFYNFGLYAESFSWTIIEDSLAIKGLAIHAGMRGNGISMQLEADVDVAKLPMKIGVEFSTETYWTAWVQPRHGNQFPGVVELAMALTGIQDTQQGFNKLEFNTPHFDAAIKKVILSFDPYKAKLHALEIHSTLKLKAISFDVVLRLPDFSFRGSLQKSTPINVREFVSGYGFSADFIPENLKIAEIELQAQPRASYYSLSAKITDIFAIGPVNLKEVSVFVSYLGIPEKVFKGQFECIVGIAKIDLQLFAEYATNTGWYFSGRTFEAKELTMDNLLEDLENRLSLKVPDVIKSIALKDIGVAFATQTKTFSFDCHGEMTISEKVLIAKIALEASGGNNSYQLKIGGELKLGQARLGLELKAGSETTFILTGKQINFAELLKTLLPDVKLPPELPSLVLEDFSLEYVPKSGVFKLDTILEMQWDNPFGLTGKTTTTFKLKVSRGESNGQKTPAEVEVGIKFKGPVAIIDDVKLKEFALTFKWERGVSWCVIGGLNIHIFDTEFGLGATYETDGESQTLILNGKLGGKDKELLNIVDVCVIKASTFKLWMKKEKTISWELEAKSGIRLADVVDLNGTLKIIHRDAEKGLIIEADPDAKIVLPLVGEPILTPPLTLQVTAPTIKILKKSASWSLQSTSKLSLVGLPRNTFVDAILPDNLTISLMIDKGGVRIKQDKITNRLALKFPDVKIGDVTVPFDALGTTQVQLRDLELKITKHSALTVTLYLGLPPEINHIFGMKDDKPAVKIFKTFDSEKPDESMVKVRFGIGHLANNKQGIIFSLDSSPFEALKIEENIWKCDLGDFGAIDINIPQFNFDGKKFGASVGFKMSKERPLQISLKPIKNLLIRSGAEDIAKIFPDAWRLMDFSVFDRSSNRLKVKELVEQLNVLLKLAGQPALPDELTSILHAIAGLSKKLPDSLIDYLDFKMPHSFSMDIDMTADGGINLDVKVDPERPIRLLIPAMLGPIPVLQGWTIKGLSVGTILAGSLFTSSVNVIIDQFDIASLLLSLSMPENSLLPKPQEIHRQVIIEDLFMLIIYQAGFPMPVPIFVKQLGIKSLGIEGVEAQAMLEFQRPTFSLSKTVQLFNNLRNFVTDPKFILPEEAVQGMDLEFKLSNIYLKTPKYLGGKLLGKKGVIVEISLIKTIATLLNGLKFFSINDLIQTVDLQYRIGNEAIEFFAMKMEAQWLLTTPKEFREGAYKRLGVAENQVESLMALVPRQDDGEGLISFLRGSWNILDGEIARLEVSFGLALTQKGFTTQLAFEGKLADIIDIKLRGRLLIHTEEIKFHIVGACFLAVANIQIFKLKGNVLVEKNRFAFAGEFRLFEGLPFSISGLIEGDLSNKGIFLQGGVEATLGPVPLANLFARVVAHLDHKETGIWLRGKFLGVTVDFEAVDNGSEFLMGFNAHLAPLAIIKADLRLNKTESKMISTATADILGFGTLVLHSQATNKVATFTLTHLGLKLGSGNSITEADGYKITGNFRLLPSTSPVNISGQLSGYFKQGIFQVDGSLEAVTFLPGVLDGVSYIINQRGVKFNFNFLGQPIANVELKDISGSIGFVLNVQLGLLELGGKFKIDKNGSNGGVALTGNLGSDISLAGEISLGHTANGAYKLFMLGQHLLDGTISINENYFILTGKIHFGPLFIELNGRINANGIYLSGISEFRIAPLPGIGIELVIDNGMPNVRMWNPLLSINSGLRIFRQQLCFIGVYKVHVFVWWYTYVAIGPHGVVELGLAQRSLPHDWPSDIQFTTDISKLPEALAVDAETIGAHLFPGISEMSFTEAVGQLFALDWSNLTTTNQHIDDVTQEKLRKTMWHYQMIISTCEEEASVSCVTLQAKNHFEPLGFFADIQKGVVNTLLAQGVLTTEDEAQQIFDIRNTKIKLQKRGGSELLTVNMECISYGSLCSLTTAVDLENLPLIYEVFAEQLDKHRFHGRTGKSTKIIL